VKLLVIKYPEMKLTAVDNLKRKSRNYLKTNSLHFINIVESLLATFENGKCNYFFRKFFQLLTANNNHHKNLNFKKSFFCF